MSAVAFGGVSLNVLIAFTNAAQELHGEKFTGPAETMQKMVDLLAEAEHVYQQLTPVESKKKRKKSTRPE